MYQAGDVKLLTPDCPETAVSGHCTRGWVQQGHAHRLHDGERAPCAFLLHSCGEWVIGGPNEIRQLITDLSTALSSMREMKPPLFPLFLEPGFMAMAARLGVAYCRPEWTHEAEQLLTAEDYTGLKSWYLDTLWPSPMRTIATGYVRT